MAIIGRPNAGKSSLTNKLTNNDRSIVSDVAGTTRRKMMTSASRAPSKAWERMEPWKASSPPISMPPVSMSELGYPPSHPGQVPAGELFFIPSVILNDDGITLDEGNETVGEGAALDHRVEEGLHGLADNVAGLQVATRQGVGGTGPRLSREATAGVPTERVPQRTEMPSGHFRRARTPMLRPRRTRPHRSARCRCRPRTCRSRRSRLPAASSSSTSALCG